MNLLKTIYGNTTKWVQTSFNSNFRNKFAAIDDTWDSTNNVFISSQPFASWTLNTTTWEWEPPTEYPDDYDDNPVSYNWNEDDETWDLIS